MLAHHRISMPSLSLARPAVHLLALIVALIAAPAPIRAQEAGDAAASAAIARIRDEGLNRSRVLELYSHLTDVIGPRLTASPAYRQAADWASERFSEWGLADARLEPFEFGRGWTLDALTLEMTAPRYFPLIGYPEAWTPSTDGAITGTPVYIGDRTAEQIAAMRDRLRGAIVLATAPQTEFITEDRQQPSDTEDRVPIGAPRMLRSESAMPIRDLMTLLQDAGAAAVLRPNQGQHGTVFVLGNRNTPDDAVPSVILAAEHYNTIVRMLQQDVPVTLRVRVDARYHEADTNGYNVLAEIPGTDLAEEVVLVGAHLDSWHSSPGATDNADGVVAVMEAARILSTLDRPRRTIRFALWGGEEQGLLGARAYAERHLAGDANAQARDRLYVYLNDDPGTGATYGFYMQEDTAAMAVFDAWLSPLRDLGFRRNVIDPIGSTDHLAFTRIDVPAFNTLKDYVDYDVRTHHTNTDFFERSSEQDLKQSAIVLAVAAWQAAHRGESLR
jgi:Zn-dependent M28 family amino/carboxypeptidase